jgi:hypothetical protein
MFLVGVVIALLLLSTRPVSCDGSAPTPTTGQITVMTCKGCEAQTREVEQ